MGLKAMIIRIVKTKMDMLTQAFWITYFRINFRIKKKLKLTR